MKKLKLIFIGLSAFAIVAIVSCAQGSDPELVDGDSGIVQLEEKMDDIEAADSARLKSNAATDVLGKEYTSKFICPDHCKGSGSDKEGECTVCGMDLMENPNYQKK